MSPPTESSDVVVVGAGVAGAHLAVALRQGGYEGSITLVGEEVDLPYDRPALSKEYFAGERPVERLPLRPEKFWTERSVRVLRGRRAVSLDPVGRVLLCDDGLRIRYSNLVWATGSRPRRLTVGGSGSGGVYEFRSRADVDRLRADLPGVSAVVVIGAGFIGLEIAPTLLKYGKKVTVVELGPRVLGRVAGPDISRFFEAEHRRHGVEIRTGVGVSTVVADADRVRGIQLADGGEEIRCEAVIAAIGTQVELQVLDRAGAETGDGVHVDEFCRTSLPNVFAVGDCAAQINRFAGGERVRIESIHNAAEQAKVVASALLGRPERSRAAPWFWSHQYDIRLQTVGLNRGYDATVLRGDVASRSFSVVYLRAGQVIALDCINASRDFMQGKALVESGAVLRAEKLADGSLSLKDILAAAV